jgi:hypothetical protein
MEERLNALAEFLEVNTDEIEVEKSYDEIYENRFIVNDDEYIVLTDEEADKLAEEQIKSSLWAFNSDFIIEHTKNYEDMDCYEYNSAVDSLKRAQADCCESLNGLVFALIDDMDEFVDDAIMADGRGHFISYCDGEEHEQGRFYIYRVD